MNKPIIAETLTRIPAIQTGQALFSLRDSGHSLPTALGEVIDNSIEAKANNILIRLDEQKGKNGKKHVHRIAVADDGAGMDEMVLHHYPVIGFSTRYMRTDTIGKYGVGAKLAALNFGLRLDVWSRTDAQGQWRHVFFDLADAVKREQSGDVVGIEPPDSDPVPEELLGLLSPTTGTLVVWSQVDRLEEGRHAANFDELRVELEKELARLFRYFLQGGIKIKVNDTELVAHDPLMQMDGSWADRVLNARKPASPDGSRSRRSPEHFASTVIGEKEIPLAGSKAKLTVTVYHKDALRKRGLGGDKLAKELRIPENQGAISFVRKNREVSYTTVPRMLPGGVTEMDRFIGIELSFDPDLDDFFGIRNVKRGVEPHGELRDKVRNLLDGYISSARKVIEETWGTAAKEEHDREGEHSPILDAVKALDVTMPKGRVEDHTPPEVLNDALVELAADVGHKDAAAQKTYVDKVKELPYIVESVDFPGNMFISTQHLAGKVIIRLNTRHPFYREMWEPLKLISEREPGTVSGAEAVKAARRTIEALTLLVITYGKAESMAPNPVDSYGELTQFWGQFLSTMLTKVKNVN
jgi:hypothetical protein